MGVYYISGIPYSSDELYHHGIIGQKWGIRRFQDKDGKYTEAGKQRYGVKNDKQAEKLANYQERARRSSENYYEAVEKSLNNRQIKLENKKQKATSVNRLMKLSNKIDKTKELRDLNKEMSKKVSKGIANMKLSDMKREKAIKGASIAGGLLLSLGTVAVASLGIANAAFIASNGYETAGLILGGVHSVGGYGSAIAIAASDGKNSAKSVRRDRERRAMKEGK